MIKIRWPRGGMVDTVDSKVTVSVNLIWLGGGMVDTGDSKSPASNSVRVQVPPKPPNFIYNH